MPNPFDTVYDTETYPNVFLLGAEMLWNDQKVMLELSPWQDDRMAIWELLSWVHANGGRMWGFNNYGFDWPVVDVVMDAISEGKSAEECAVIAYEKAQAIFSSQGDNRFAHTIWDRDQFIPQIDIFKIHHFDNVARATSLKMIEFNREARSVVDLPYDPAIPLTQEQVPHLRYYCGHDVSETKGFTLESLPQIEFREELSIKTGRNVMNFNDTKIGKEYFIDELEKKVPGICYTREPGRGKKPRQTFRPSIPLSSVIFPYVQFERPEFNRVLNYLKSQIISDTKGVFKDLHATVDGFDFHFGTGGIHGSVSSCTVESNDKWVIKDYDVASYYPNLAIVNRVYPEHLSEQFCDIYKDVYEQRKTYKKGTPENAMLKLALNGVYGDSNNAYSPFYDPAYTMTITLNGQLLLCMLAEQLMKIIGLEMIQINTDGLTVRMPRSAEPLVEPIIEWWQRHTLLELEDVTYSRMFIRDVNNYIAKKTDGKLKNKGAYVHLSAARNKPDPNRVLGWHQNHSALIVPKAAEAALVHGADIETFIREHRYLYDFMLRTRKPRGAGAHIVWSKDGLDHPAQNVTRYLVTKEGGALIKILPPLARDLKKAPDDYEQIKIEAAKEVAAGHDMRSGTALARKVKIEQNMCRRIGIDVGWMTTMCNDLDNLPPFEIDYDYYIKAAEKLVEPLKNKDRQGEP
jgi:hypothetical protein